MSAMQWVCVYKSWLSYWIKTSLNEKFNKISIPVLQPLRVVPNMLKTMDPDFINWVKSQLDEQAAKTKQILTALLHFSPILVEKNWQRVAWRFSLAILAFFICFRFIPVPFSAYMVQQKSATYYS